ncbi:MAG: hypothetical protein AAF772_04330, partial [Acidobacteriota bacterium]
ERLDDAQLRGRYYFWLAHTHTYLGNADPAETHARTAQEAAQAAGDEVTEGQAAYVLGREGFWSGRFLEGAEASKRAVILLERNGVPWWQGQAHWVAAFNHFALGGFPDAFEAIERARAMGEALADPRLDPAWSIGYFYAHLGDGDTGVRYGEEAVANAQDPLNAAVALGFLGYAQLQRGDVGAAIDNLERASSQMADSGMRQISSWFDVFLAEAYAEADRGAQAQTRAAKGLSVAEAAHFVYGIALAERTLGRLATDAGERDAAAARLTSAAERFTALQMPYEQAMTDLVWVRLHDADGARDAARDAWQRARERFAALQVPALEARTEALGQQLGLAS